jgi:multidrug efflux system outer membrane protein
MRPCKVASLLLLLAGCQLGPKYCVPESNVPEKWKSSEEAASSSVEVWWEIFQDEELSKLEAQVVKNNFDLKLAMERVAEARAKAGVKGADLYPQANLTPNYNNIQELIELYGVPPGLFPGLKTIVRVHELEYQLPLAMSYEVDLWRKYRGKYDSAVIYAQAVEEAYRGTMLTLTSDLASNYFNLRSLDTQIDLLTKTVALRQDFLDLTKQRYKVGVSSLLDVLQAEEVLTNTVATLDDSVRQRALFENAIALLIGLPASDFHVAVNPLTIEPPHIPAGLPSSVLLRRPDIAQAERDMASQHALIGVAWANFFPAFTLTGAIGFASPELFEFLNWKARLWQIGLSIAQTVFDGWRNKSNLDMVRAQFRETQAVYEQTVLGAFKEVEDALSNVKQQSEQYANLSASYKSASQFAALSILRYETGVSNYLDAIQSELNELSAQISWMNILGARYQSTTQLIKAIGGGWDNMPPIGEN